MHPGFIPYLHGQRRLFAPVSFHTLHLAHAWLTSQDYWLGMGHTYLSPQDGLKGPADPVVAGMGREICTYFGRQEIRPPPTAGYSQPSVLNN